MNIREKLIDFACGVIAFASLAGMFGYALHMGGM